ncbi:unnamed protein product [Anisakis simplex]|uniref:Uncharacterized protein n=1 Tax=Anisakis simplex TaxID=6269 RepID=A0A3P6QT37_ANISI|nr:unnamed protein product [Anisakis simplex]
MLKESNEEVSELVLHKVIYVLDTLCWSDDELDIDNIAAQLVCLAFGYYALIFDDILVDVFREAEL